MRKIIIKFISVIFLLFVPPYSVQPVFAHGGEERIEVSAIRLNPGSVLDLRGVGFEPEVEVALSLVGSQSVIPLGTAVADMEGIFLLTLTLPVDLMEGEYVIQGVTNDHTVDSPPITIWGTADLGSADAEPRAEDDGLLAPMPTTAAGAPTPIMASAPLAETAPVENSTIPYAWIAAGVAIGLLAITLLVLRFRQ
jgi:hypothetical protein